MTEKGGAIEREEDRERVRERERKKEREKGGEIGSERKVDGDREIQSEIER